MSFEQMEDEGSYGNDDIRCFILSNLATAKMSKTFCVVCQNAMQIYDRYPLIDGTFFLAPKQYSKACIPVSNRNFPFAVLEQVVFKVTLKQLAISIWRWSARVLMAGGFCCVVAKVFDVPL